VSCCSFSEPTHFVIGLLLDPCRNRSPDCCSDTFGEPVRDSQASTPDAVLTPVLLC
jgi:hypothetical protein